VFFDGAFRNPEALCRLPLAQPFDPPQGKDRRHLLGKAGDEIIDPVQFVTVAGNRLG
tara:strand:- start:13 stop:183 length:171 start_codon:yes stop_codon:yes gene_type:complete